MVCGGAVDALAMGRYFLEMARFAESVPEPVS